LADQKLPLYGDGKNVRDWIHVLDHCKGVWKVAMEGKTGKVYNLGGGNEWANIDIAKEILKAVGKDESLIELVKDRPGHDRRYAMDYSLAEKELGWRPEYNFEQGLLETVSWYQDNKQWWESVKDGSYREYYNKQYAN
jgi:dTDP-glucose 4,6-dehydratase